MNGNATSLGVSVKSNLNSYALWSEDQRDKPARKRSSCSAQSNLARIQSPNVAPLVRFGLFVRSLSISWSGMWRPNARSRPPRQANLALSIISSIWTWAARRDEAEFTKIPASRLERKPRADLTRPWEAVRRHAVPEGVRLYNLRHSFASVGAGASLGLSLLGTAWPFGCRDDTPIRASRRRPFKASRGYDRYLNRRRDGW
jgi:hypothetical protein